MKRSTAFLLVLAIVSLLVANSADFFFRTPFYETWDSAANALSVDQAKHFAQLYGPYSRWGFYHPGPTLFYLQALGEWLFFDLLHWTPAPYNAQTLLYLFVSVGFFVEALRVFARWLPAGRWRWWFLCAALVAATLHFTAVNTLRSYDPVLGPNAFFSLWSAHALVLPFLCLLVAGASVAAGGGQELPLLALADGYLLQMHVAQPLFVLPLTALAAVGLVWRCAAQAKDRVGLEWSRRRRIALGLSAGWRAFRREHLLAAVILGFFALPVVIDLRLGEHSNLAAIVQHLRQHQGEHKTLVRSVCYFLQFGGYAPYRAGTIEFTDFTREGMKAYLGAHRFAFGCWAACLLAALWALSGAVRPPEVNVGDPLSESRVLRGSRPEHQRFLAWAATFLLMVLLLSLKWGTIQDGEMFYYNAWFNFAIYYFGVLIALATASGWMLALCKASVVVWPRWQEYLAGVAAVSLTGVLLTGELRVYDADPASTLAFHESMRRALAATREGHEPVLPKILHFPVGEWVMLVGVALEIERAHQPFYVTDQWGVNFGQEHAWKAVSPKLIRRHGLQDWRLEYLPNLPPPMPGSGIVLDTGGRLHIVTPALDSAATGWGDYLYLKVGVPAVDPNAVGGAKLNFRLGNPTADYGIAGWCDAEPFGTWSSGHHAVTAFRAVPVPAGSAGVEIALNMLPLVDTSHGLRFQRVRIFFNGEPLGEQTRLDGYSDTLRCRVPAERWNRAANFPVGGSVLLELDLPDAISPAELVPDGSTTDTRVMGVGMGEVRFQALPPARPFLPAPAPSPEG